MVITERRKQPELAYMQREHLEQVLEIEEFAYPHPWDRAAFLGALRTRKVACKVLHIGGDVLGYSVVAYTNRSAYVLSLAVAWNAGRKGVGAMLVDDIKGRLTDRRRRIVVEIRERNMDGLKFLSRQGFSAVSTLRNPYEDSEEDAIVMEFQKTEPIVAEAACQEEIR